MDMTLRPRRVAGFLLVILAFFTLAHLAGKILEIRTDNSFGLEVFDLDGVQSIPRFFASVILLFSALLLFLVTWAKKKERGGGYLYWLGLGLVFLYLAVDKSAGIHDTLASSLRLSLGLTKLEFYAWTYGIVALILPLAYSRFLFKLPKKTTLLFVLGGVLFLLGAFGLDLVVAYLGRTIDRESAVYIGLSALEEVMEMGGVIVFIYALLSYLATELKWNCIKITV